MELSVILRYIAVAIPTVISVILFCKLRKLRKNVVIGSMDCKPVHFPSNDQGLKDVEAGTTCGTTSVILPPSHIMNKDATLKFTPEEDTFNTEFKPEGPVVLGLNPKVEPSISSTFIDHRIDHNTGDLITDKLIPTPISPMKGKPKKAKPKKKSQMVSTKKRYP